MCRERKRGLPMDAIPNPQLTNSLDYHVLHERLNVAIPIAEHLTDLYPRDLALLRLCIHLYEAMELMQREPLEEEFSYQDLLVAGRSNAA